LYEGLDWLSNNIANKVLVSFPCAITKLHTLVWKKYYSLISVPMIFEINQTFLLLSITKIGMYSCGILISLCQWMQAWLDNSVVSRSTWRGIFCRNGAMAILTLRLDWPYSFRWNLADAPAYADLLLREKHLLFHWSVKYCISLLGFSESWFVMLRDYSLRTCSDIKTVIGHWH
jgi:hypothetical protein